MRAKLPQSVPRVTPRRPMLFFKSIFKPAKSEEPQDRRGARRYPISPRFPLKVVLNAVGRDEMGSPLKARDGEGWDWAGKLVNLSSTGARMQVPPTVHMTRGDACLLKFDLDGFQLVLPAHVAQIIERRDSLVYGLALDISDSESAAAYRQLLDLLALGATLKPSSPARPDNTSYLIEQYTGEPASRLDVWRHYAGRTVAAFDFQLQDCRVRGVADRPALEYFVGDGAAMQAATREQTEEMQRLFHWVVANLSTDVPADVRDFLQKYTE